MIESIPTSAYVRESYAREKHPDSPELIELRRQGFDRWLCQVQFEAVEEFKRRMRSGRVPEWTVNRMANPYREDA